MEPVAAPGVRFTFLRVGVEPGSRGEAAKIASPARMEVPGKAAVEVVDEEVLVRCVCNMEQVSISLCGGEGQAERI